MLVFASLKTESRYIFRLRSGYIENLVHIHIRTKTNGQNLILQELKFGLVFSLLF